MAMSLFDTTAFLFYGKHQGCRKHEPNRKHAQTGDKHGTARVRNDQDTQRHGTHESNTYENTTRHDMHKTLSKHA